MSRPGSPGAGTEGRDATEFYRSLTLGLVLGLAVSPAALADRPLADRAPVVVRVMDGGFHWGDAAIGAAAGGGLTLLVGGSIVGARRKSESSYTTPPERSSK